MDQIVTQRTAEPPRAFRCFFSWAIGQPMLPQFADAVPYAIAIVELEEGVRMATWVVDVPPGELSIGLPVEVSIR
jgi:uncharacterized protein